VWICVCVFSQSLFVVGHWHFFTSCERFQSKHGLNRAEGAQNITERWSNVAVEHALSLAMTRWHGLVAWCTGSVCKLSGCTLPCGCQLLSVAGGQVLRVLEEKNVRASPWPEQREQLELFTGRSSLHAVVEWQAPTSCGYYVNVNK